MKNIANIALIAVTMVIVFSCGSDVKRKPANVYMPDMAYSQAYETYSVTEEVRDSLRRHDINYSNLPVPGTISTPPHTVRSNQRASNGKSTRRVNIAGFMYASSTTSTTLATAVSVA